MSQPSPFGPFPPAAPKPLEAAAMAGAGAPARMEYLRSFQYIFENPNWLMNLVWSFLCQLAGQVIPILPAMVFWGYQFEMIEDLHANRGRRYPDFDINRVADYLGRGVWPVLVFLMYAFGFMFLAIGLFIVTLVCGGMMGNAGGDDLGSLFAMLGILMVFLVGGLIGAGLSIYCTPMMLRAGITQELGAAFDFRWVNDFVSKMWVETILSALFLFFSVFSVVLVTCGIGGIVLGPMMPFVSTYLMYQLYSLYLSRGGTPIPFKPRMPAAPAGYASPPSYAPPPQY
jgi:hypothetical protein